MRRLRGIIRLHNDLNWSQIARECLRKKMRGAGLLKEIVAARDLTVRQALSLDKAVKKGFTKARRVLE